MNFRVAYFLLLSNFSIKIRKFILFFFPVFFSDCVYSQALKGFASNNDEKIRKCYDFCEKIKFIHFSVVDKTDKKLADRKYVFMEAMNEILIANKKKDVINIVVFNFDGVRTAYNILSSAIQFEIDFIQEPYDISIVDVEIKVITPTEVYIKRMTCNTGKDFSCIDSAYKFSAESIIGNYLFKPTVRIIKN